MITVSVCDTGPLCGGALYEKAYRLVTEERRRKTDRLRFQKDKCLSLGAELLLADACLGAGFSLAPERIEKGEHGKPRFASGRAFFNLSHSGEKAMCVFGDSEAGCDIEKAGKYEPALAERFFSEEEKSCLKRSEDPERDFFRLWTLKESFIKCTGLGLALPFAAFSVELKGSGARLAGAPDGGAYRFFEFDGIKGYKCACCVRGESNDVSFRTVRLEDLIGALS